MLQSGGRTVQSQSLLREVFKQEVRHAEEHERMWRREQRGRVARRVMRRGPRAMSARKGSPGETSVNPIGWGVPAPAALPSYRSKSLPRAPAHGVLPPYSKKDATKSFYDSAGGIACLYPLSRDVSGFTL